MQLNILEIKEYRAKFQYGAFGTSLVVGPMVKISPSKAGDVGSIPGWGTKSHMPCIQKSETSNRSNIVMNSTKAFKKNGPTQYDAFVIFNSEMSVSYTLLSYFFPKNPYAHQS